jgi:predicted house-cleaning NTP pyrophosphatase (Maf/HAM1 superfamily)
MRLILASSSKYRQAFAKEWGLSFTCIHPNINEDIISTDTHTNRSQCPPDQLCLAIAKAKASAVLEILKAQKEEEECLIVTSDQVSWFNQRIREKPRDLAQAREWMIEYQKSPIRVCTAIVVTHFPSERPEFVNNLKFKRWNLTNCGRERNLRVKCTRKFQLMYWMNFYRRMKY